MLVNPQQRNRIIGAGGFALANYRNLYRVANEGWRVAKQLRQRIRSGNTQSRAEQRMAVNRSGFKRRGNKKVNQNAKRRKGVGPSSFGGSTVTTTAPGFYQGKVRGVTRRKAAKRGSIYDVTGYRKETEQFGSATGVGGLVRLGVKAYPADDMLVAVWISIIRYLLKKHYGYVYTNVDAAINVNNPGGNIGRPAYLIVRFARDQGPGIRTFITHQRAINQDSIRTTATWFASEFLTSYNEASAQPNQKDEYYPFDYRFYDEYVAGGVAVSGETAPGFPFQGMKIALYGNAQVVVQNTSRHDTTTSDAIGFVDNNPVCGNICYVKGQTVDPKTLVVNDVTSNELGFNYVTGGNDGVMFTETTVGQAWRAVQPLSMFKRGVKQLSISLDPGASQSYNVFYKYYGLVSTWFMKYWPDSQNGLPNPSVQHNGTGSRYGGMNMIALLQLEKRISTGGQPVRVNYHVDFHLGTRVVRGPVQPRWTVDYAERNVNDVAPAALMVGNDEKMEVGLDNDVNL